MFTGMRLNEPAEQYHSAQGYIQSSPLRQMSKSPRHFFNAWQNGSEPTPAMDRGTFMHSLLLELDIEKFVPRPKKNDRLVASNTAEYKDFLAANPGKTPIEPELYEEASAILDSACANKYFLKAWEASHKEASTYALHQETGLYLKARKDKLAVDRSFLLDVKSTADISKFEKQIFTLGYDIRLVHYAETVRALEGVSIPEIYFFAIESKAPYGCKMFRLSQAARDAAFIQWEVWMNEISVCMKENKWPSYSDDIVDVDRPAYLAVEDVSFEGVG